MASLREIRRRIRSISSTAQITRAMQMVAASKMRKAQESTLTTRPFGQTLYRIQRLATFHARDFVHPLLEKREVRRRAVILVGTDKGLCGSLNSNLFRAAPSSIRQPRYISRWVSARRSSSREPAGNCRPSSR